MLSRYTRVLAVVSAALFAAVGIFMFFFPRYAAAGFPWPISPLVSMTMGAWYLAAAINAFEAARRWRWPEVKGLLVFVWMFPLLELAVVVAHRAGIDPLREFTTLYVGSLCVTALAGMVGIVDWLRVLPAASGSDQRMPVWLRAFALLFVVLVGGIALYALGGSPRGGQVWPAILQPIAVGAFGAFYLALALAVAVLLFDRTVDAIVAFGTLGLVTIVLVLVPAVLFVDRWNFAAKPLGLLYHGAYVAVGLVTLYSVLRVGRRA